MFRKPNAPFYLQVWPDRLKMTDTATGKSAEIAPVMALRRAGKHTEVAAIGEEAETFRGQEGCEVIKPFADHQQLLENFDYCEKIVRHLFEKNFNTLFLRPLLIIHPMGTYKNWVSGIEQEFFYELGLVTVARDVAVYVGEELTTFDFDALKPKKKLAAKEWMQRIVLVMLLGVLAWVLYYAYKQG